MTPINKGIGVLALSLISGIAVAQNPGVEVTQDITSKISVTNVDGFNVAQQIGSPFGSPVLIEGDDILYQGLFGALTGGSNSGTVGVGSIFGDNENYGLAFDAVSKSVQVKLPAATSAKIIIVDMKGQMVMSQSVSDMASSIDLTNLAPGVYMAGAATDNKFSKTLKFILK